MENKQQKIIPTSSIGYSELEIDAAFEAAKKRRLPILIDFWAPGCKGCEKMDAVTYQDEGIISYVQQHFVLVKYDITNKTAARITSSPILWTPSFIVFSNDGGEIRKVTGYLPPAQFKGEMELGRALATLRKADSRGALQLLEDFINSNRNPILLPEALYWSGVVAYFLNQRNADSLVPYWSKLTDNFPDSPWAERADCLDRNPNILIQ